MNFKLFLVIIVFLSVNFCFGQTEKGWSVEAEITNEKLNNECVKIIYFAPRLELIGDDSIALVSDSGKTKFAIQNLVRLSYYRDGRSGWKGTFIGTLVGATIGVLIFTNNDKNDALDRTERTIGASLTGLLSGVIGGAAGGLIYKRRTIEDVEILSGLPYAQKQMLVRGIKARY